MQAGNAAVRLLERFDHADGKAKVAAANEFFAQYINAEEISDRPLHFTADTHPDTLRQQAYYWAAEYFYEKQLWTEAEQYGLKALPLCRNRADRTLEGDCLNLISITYIRLANYEKAAKYAKQCNGIDLENGDADNISSSFNTLAAIYMSARQPKEAEKYILKAIEYSQQADNPQRKAVLYGMASEVYHALQDEQQSYDYARMAFETEQTIGRADKALVREAQMVSALMGLKRYDEAKTLLQKVIPAFRENGNRHSLGISCNRMGSMLLDEDSVASAAVYFSEALAIFTEQHDIYNESFSRKGLYRALKKADPEAAMHHLERYNELKDSIYDHDTGELLSKYAALYDNAQLQLENENERAAHRRSILIAAAIIALLALGGWLYVQARRKRHQQHLEELMAQIESLMQQSQQPEAEAEPQTEADTDTAAEEPTDSTDSKEIEEKKFLAQVVEAVNAGLLERRFDVDTIASQLNMSTTTFRRQLKSATGEMPKAFINAIQMKKAANLLQTNGDIPISEVAWACGFDESSNFSRTFKKFFDLTPSQYLKKIGEKNDTESEEDQDADEDG